MSENASQSNSRVPAWVAGLAVLILLAGSAWVLYKFVWSNRQAVAVERVTVNPPLFGGNTRRDTLVGRPERPAPPAFSVSRMLSGRIRARHGGVVVYAIPKGSGYDSIIEYEDAKSWVSPAQWEIQILAGRPMQYPALAEKIALKPDQKAKIEALTYQPPLSAAEKTDFDKLFTAWFKAPQKEKDAAAEELSNAVQSAAKKHLAEAQAALQKRCAEVTTILTPEQMLGIREFFNTAAPRANNQR